MKWQVTDKKYNPATRKTQEYNIVIETTEKNNMVKAEVTVPACPRGQRPVVWHTTNVSTWLKEKGFDIADILQTETLSDTTNMTGTYSFSLKQKQHKNKQRNTNKIRKTLVKPSIAAPNRLSATDDIVVSNLITETE
jgi:hypothetical protein